ncbi:MAG: type II toxin-antitoxin system RelE/ParE family toxin [Coriobacteriales bacterium]|nr:type II toxin-antitoxin system RelE/ParE family toxin [Coriobacteriales bacterium]
MAGEETEEVIYSFRFDSIAQEQLVEAVEYYTENASEEVARRFLIKIETITEMLCVWPEVGIVLEGFPEVRSCKVPKFPYRVYYRINQDILEVVAVSIYHSSRDLDKLLFDLKKRLLQ